MRPLQNLKAQNLELIDDYHKLLDSYISSGNYVAGTLTSNFERELSEFTNCEYAIAVSSGTAALEIALKSAGVSPGDYVGIPALTFVATAYAVVSCGAVPVLIDIDQKSWNISLETIQDSFLRHKFKFLIPVHLHGQIIDLKSINEFALENNILIIEDAAQSLRQGSQTYSVAKYSQAAATSFYPGKNLGSITEGGAILTNSSSIAQFASKYRNWGAEKRYEHDFPGGNFRISEFGAGILSIKLQRLSQYISKRREIVKLYNRELANTDNLQLPIDENGLHTFHIYSILSPYREFIEKELYANGFQTGKHYPRTIEANNAYKQLVISGDIRNSKKFSLQCLSLPLDEFLNESEVIQIAQIIKRCLDV